MPFGLHNALATFQRMMNYVLQEYQDIAGAYINDVVIFSHGWGERLGHLRNVFSQLQLAGLTETEEMPFRTGESTLLRTCYWKG